MVNFEYESTKEFKYTSGYILKTKKFRASYIKFPTLYKKPAVGTETVEFYLFDPKDEPIGVLMILHGLGTQNIPFLLWMASHLANAGIRTVVPILPGNFTRTADGSVSGKDFFDIDVEHSTKFWEHSIVDVLTIVDFLKVNNLWRENANLFGFCLGGMISVIINALKKDLFRKTLLMTVGGEMSALMWKSPTLAYVRRQIEKHILKPKRTFEHDITDKDKFFEKFSQDIKKLQHFKSVEEMQNSDIHPYLKIDPLAYAKFVDREKIIFIEALFDKALPLRSRNLLWKALGKPKRYIIPSGHVTWLPFQFIVTGFIMKVMGIKEFKKKLEAMKRIELEEGKK